MHCVVAAHTSGTDGARTQAGFASTIDLTALGNSSITGHLARQSTLNKASSVGWLPRASHPSPVIAREGA